MPKKLTTFQTAINWEATRIFIVDSSKTEHHQRRAIRVVPLLPQIETELLKLHLEAEDGAEYVFPLVSGQTNLRTNLERIIRKAGVTQWPKLWHNLRASGATDFARTLPSHVAAEICGHTEEIAKEHYWQVSDSDLDLAIKKLGGSHGVSIDSGKECPIVSQSDSGEKASEISQVATGAQFNAICRLLAEVGFTNQVGEEGTEQGPFSKGFEAPGQDSCTIRGSINRISDIQGIAEALELLAGRCLELDQPSLSQAVLQALTDHLGLYREVAIASDCVDVAAK